MECLPYPCTGLLLPPEKACVRRCPEEQERARQGPRGPLGKTRLHVPQDGGPCSTEAGKRQNVIQIPDRQILSDPTPLPDCRLAGLRDGTPCLQDSGPCICVPPAAAWSWQPEKEKSTSRPALYWQGGLCTKLVYEPIPIQWCSAAWRKRRRRRGSRR